MERCPQGYCVTFTNRRTKVRKRTSLIRDIDKAYDGYNISEGHNPKNHIVELMKFNKTGPPTVIESTEMEG